MNSTELVIGYGEGIRSAEDVDFFFLRGELECLTSSMAL